VGDNVGMARGVLIVQLPGGTVEDLDLRHALEEQLDGALRRNHAGHVDGGNIGSGTMNIYLFPASVDRAAQVVLAHLRQRGLLGSAVVVRRTPTGRYRVLWPEGFSGAYTEDHEIYGLPELLRAGPPAEAQPQRHPR
jgi:L-aminopeptidase/D-esterase-like protein